MGIFVRNLTEDEANTYMPMRELYEPQQDEVYEAAGEYLVEAYEFDGALDDEYHMLVRLSDDRLVEFECGVIGDVSKQETDEEDAEFKESLLDDEKYKSLLYKSMVEAWRICIYEQAGRGKHNNRIAGVLARDLAEKDMLDIDEEDALNLCLSALLEAEYFPLKRTNNV